MNLWWFAWTMFVVIFLASPVGYGWGYRQWGPPYPRYVQRRRGARASALGGSATFDHHSWGWRGDFVWMMLLVGMVWMAVAFWWR